MSFAHSGMCRLVLQRWRLLRTLSHEFGQQCEAPCLWRPGARWSHEVRSRMQGVSRLLIWSANHRRRAAESPIHCSNDCQVSPLCNWNKVYFAYCDGNSFSGMAVGFRSQLCVRLSSRFYESAVSCRCFPKIDLRIVRGNWPHESPIGCRRPSRADGMETGFQMSRFHDVAAGGASRI